MNVYKRYEMPFERYRAGERYRAKASSCSLHISEQHLVLSLLVCPLLNPMQALPDVIVSCILDPKSEIAAEQELEQELEQASRCPGA